MKMYQARVMVEYVFDFEAEDDREAEQYAWDHYHENPYRADVYSVDTEVLYDLEEDEDEDD